MFFIREMVSSFISKPNSIILAVSPASMDIATSDSLRLAKNFDPNGERTIGVLVSSAALYCDMLLN